MKICAVVLAGGMGKRMNVPIPKCIYPFLNKPMIEYIIDALNDANIYDICVVTGYKKEEIMNTLKDKVIYSFQPILNGTAGALISTVPYFKEKEGYMIIIPGDMPFIDKEIIDILIKTHILNNNDLTVVTTIMDEPFGYGRIIKKNNQLISIVEELDATPNQKKIKEVNSGIYMINVDLLEEALFEISNNNKQNEYYLTDIVKVLSIKKQVSTCYIKDSYKLTGINDLKTLKKLEEII